jgi:hypothetical protein
MMAKTNAQKQRAMRQEELRELLAKKGLTQKVIEDIKKIDELASIRLDDYEDADTYLAELTSAKDKVQMIKVAIDSRMKLVSKYLPDLKQQELVGDGGGPIETSVPVMFVDAED